MLRALRRWVGRGAEATGATGAGVFAAAALWAVLPMKAENVAWISGRGDILGAAAPPDDQGGVTRRLVQVHPSARLRQLVGHRTQLPVVPRRHRRDQERRRRVDVERQRGPADVLGVGVVRGLDDVGLPALVERLDRRVLVVPAALPGGQSQRRELEQIGALGHAFNCRPR